MHQISLILFDIGNVLVKLTGASVIQNNSRKTLSKEYVWDTWTKIKAVREFETGKMSSLSFAQQVIEYYDLVLDPHQFICLFRSAAEKKFDGVDVFLTALSRHVELACLTNTNPIQWPKIKTEFGLGKYFARQYVSYEIGLMKPDVDVYSYVLKDTCLEPANIVFIDDNLENIQAAAAIGLRCCLVNGFNDAQNQIRALLHDSAQQGCEVDAASLRELP